MEALIASYGEDSDTDDICPSVSASPQSSSPLPTVLLPSPPVSLLNPPNSLATLDYLPRSEPSRVRSFPHVEGNYALHVFIPVFVPLSAKKEIAHLLKKISSSVPGLHVVDVDIPFDVLSKDDQKLENVALGREFHISLGRTVPIRVHQIDSIVSMLRQKLRFQKRFWIDFCKWSVFVNDDTTRTFLSLEVTRGGVAEVKTQIQAVNEVYRLHNLPEFYQDPRPHISLVWALGDISNTLEQMVREETMRQPINVGSSQNRMFTVQFGGIECKIGNKTYKICKVPAE